MAKLVGAPRHIGKRNIIHQLLEEYDIQSAEDIQDALKDLLGGTIKEMIESRAVKCQAGS